MDKQIKARITWVNFYIETKDAGFVCRKCGISRPTIRKWYQRYLKDSLQELIEQSKIPHLNGKVECSQKTDLEEFYAIADLSNFENLNEELAQWQFFYNWQRPHGSLKGKTPSEIVADLGEKTPLSEEICKLYNVNHERI